MGVFRRQWPGVSYGRGEDWHYVGGGGEPGFEHSWANASGEMKMAFRIREAGVVDLHGVVSGGSSSNSIFTLPADYRPSTSTFAVFHTSATDAYGRLLIGTDGTVTPIFSAGSKVFIACQFWLYLPVTT